MPARPNIDLYSPADLLAMFDAVGVVVSERTLRAQARRLGACRQIGNALFFTDQDVKRLIEGLVPCGSTDAATAKIGGSKPPLPADELGKARARLTGKRPKKSPTKRNGRHCEVVSLGRNPSPPSRKR